VNVWQRHGPRLCLCLQHRGCAVHAPRTMHVMRRTRCQRGRCWCCWTRSSGWVEPQRHFARPTAHAQAMALRAAGGKLASHRLSGCCPVRDAGAVRHARVGRMVHAAADPGTECSTPWSRRATTIASESRAGCLPTPPRRCCASSSARAARSDRWPVRAGRYHRAIVPPLQSWCDVHGHQSRRPDAGCLRAPPTSMIRPAVASPPEATAPHSRSGVRASAGRTD